MHSKTPDYYCMKILANYLTESNKNEEIEFAIKDVDLIATSLLSLRRIDSQQANYAMYEPAALEAVFYLMQTDPDVEKKFMQFCCDEGFFSTDELLSNSADGKGKVFDKIIALRFRMG